MLTTEPCEELFVSEYEQVQRVRVSDATVFNYELISQKGYDKYWI